MAVQKTINFLRAKNVAFGFSILLIVAGLLSLLLKRGPNLGIDFKGGVHVIAKFGDAVTVGQVTETLAAGGITPSKVVTAPDNEILIDAVADEPGTGQRIVELLRASHNVADAGITEIGANVGQDLRRSGILMIFLSIALLLIYISLRFQWRFAIGAVIAMAHDVLIVLGIFSWLNLEINLPTLAAFLTVVGYSVNDTIVIYDRIRENQRLLRGMRLEELINISLTQTLSRTLLTAPAALFVIVSIYLNAGLGDLRTFSLALIFGIIIGTFSSIYIASPIVLLLRPRTSLAES